MPKKNTKKKEQDDLAGCIGALITLPILIYLWFEISKAWNKSAPSNTTTTKVQLRPTPQDVASKKCRKAIRDKYSAVGYDVYKLASQRFAVSKRDDGTWYADIAVPFKTTDRITGRRDRTFWINVRCEISKSGFARIVEEDTAGYPG